MSLTDEIDAMEDFAVDVDEMDTNVTTVVALELIAGVMVLPNLLIIMTGMFPFFSYSNPPYPFLLLFANLVYTVILILLVPSSIYLAWSLWKITPSARFATIVANVISLIVHLPTLSPVLFLNLFLVFFLNTHQMREVYLELPSDLDSLE